MLSVHEKQQYVHVAWRNTGYSRSLSYSFGPMPFEFLSPLGRYGHNRGIVDIGREAHVFEASELVGDELFARNVATIFNQYFGSLYYFLAPVVGELGNEFL